MKIGERLARLDVLQRSRVFRIAASIAVIVVAGLLYGGIVYAAHQPTVKAGVAQRAQERARLVTGGLPHEVGPIGAVRRGIDSMLVALFPIDEDELRRAGAPDELIERMQATVRPLGILTIFGLVTIVSVAVICLGLGLIQLGLLLVGWGLGLGLSYAPGTGELGELIIAVTPLALAFATGMELAKLALSGPWPVLAIARNVLNEAVRMKISVVFIVLLLLLLALTPGLLAEDQPLRYRVQNWLQYGTGISYAVLALLTLFFSTATVAFEQRDRLIWQTMVKPVRSWEYLVGKWLGVVMLNVVLLSVTAGGVYLFTEYLQRQPANGEIAYQVREDGAITRGQPGLMTEDRRLLETQVLVARVGRYPEPANLLESGPLLRRAVELKLRERMSQDSSVQDTRSERARIREQVRSEFRARIDQGIEARLEDEFGDDAGAASPGDRAKAAQAFLSEFEQQYRTIERGGARTFLFAGVRRPNPRSGQSALTLKYKVNAGSNDPGKIYRVLVEINGMSFERQIGLDAGQQMDFDAGLVSEGGTLDVTIFNDPENPREISFAPTDLEVLYVAGGYEMNFVRIMLAMWIKLAFVAAVGVAMSTFLGFPVACLVTMSVLFMAESAGFLDEALQHYTAITTEGRDWIATIDRLIAVPVAWTFSIYNDLKPTANLVDGRLVAWSSLALSTAVLGVWTVVVMFIGWLVFRQRELAIYSGR